MQLRGLGREPAALAGDQLIARRVVGMLAQQARLEHAVLAHRLGQGGQLVLVEIPPRLEPAGVDLLDRDGTRLAAGLSGGAIFVGVLAEQRAEAASERAALAAVLGIHSWIARSRLSTSLAR